MAPEFRYWRERALTAALTLALVMPAASREWTSTNGQKLEADFLSATPETVIVRRAADRREVSLPLARLSEGDREWVRSQQGKVPKTAAPAAASAATTAWNGPYAPLATGDWALSKFKNLPFALRAPKDLKAGQVLPLVVLLHGKSSNDENGKQVADWMNSFAKPERQAKRPCVLLAPLCYQPHGGTGGGWSDVPGQETVALIKDLLKSLPLDKERIYVAGHSMGGFGTCHLLTSEPRLFAAGIPIAGCSGAGAAGTLKRMPIWVFHAADDDVVKVEGARALDKALNRSKTFKYTEYANGGHGIAGRVFDTEEVHEWLFGQGGKN